jgi:hypothetical protein
LPTQASVLRLWPTGNNSTFETNEQGRNARSAFANDNKGENQ